MPIDIFKGSVEYCLSNKPFFLLIFILYLIIEFFFDVVNNLIFDLIAGILIIFLMGCGLQIIQDVINGDTTLPKLSPKKMFSLGLKSTVIFLFYGLIQTVLLISVSDMLNFPEFDLHEVYSDPHHVLNMMYGHDVVSFIIFITLGFAISYAIIFFMELSLAKLADGEKLRKSFNFRKIKHAIDIIGWKNYTVGYTKIILVLMILTYINKFFNPYDDINFIIGSLTLLLSFIVEFRGMGNVYRVYVENKNNI